MSDEVVRWFPLERVEELERAIQDALHASRQTTRRDALACALGLQGLRVGEACRLTIGDLEVAARRLLVKTLKGGRVRRIRLAQPLVDSLQRECLTGDGPLVPGRLLLPGSRADRRYNPEQPIGPQNQPLARLDSKRPQALATRIFKKLLGRGHHLTFHSLRHTFAMRLLAASGDITLVQRELGHASVQTTMVYARCLKEVPEDVLVRVGVDRPRPGQQLRLPFESPLPLRVYRGA